MNGKEFKKIIRLNGLTQEDAAKIFNVSRQTISVWCKSDIISDKIVKIINDRFSVKSSDFSTILSVSGENNVSINGNNVNSPIDNRQYYSDSPDVLRAQVEELERLMADKEERLKEKDAQIKEKDAQIKEKDAQIKEKDAQIHRLLNIIETSVSGEKGQK